MRNFLVMATFLLAITGCRAWSAADQADYDRHCPDGSCSITVIKESKPNYCNNTITPIDCQKDNPNAGTGNPRPSTGSSGNTDQGEGTPCTTGKDCPGSIEGSATSTPGQGTGTGTGTGNGQGGGALEGAGDVLTHWGNEIGKGWEGIKGELNGSNAENRRKKREAKRLIREMQDLWNQADAYGVSIDDDRKAAGESWALLDDSWKDFGLASREKDLEEFRGRYNTRTKGILDGIPRPDPSVFDGLGKGRGDGIYPEHQKIENDRKFLKYARDKLDPNAADYGVRKTLVDFGDSCLDEAETSYRSGNVMEGNAWYEIGMAAADAALSLTPGTGWAKDTYEAITGKNLLTGKELNKFERTMAIAGALIVGVAKFGALAKAGKLVGVMATTAKTAEEAEKVTQAGREAVAVLEASAKMGAKTADEVKDLMTVSQGVNEAGDVAKGIETVNAGREATDLSAKELRNGAGIANSSKPLYDSEALLRGTNDNAGLVPKQIGDKLAGNSYKNFNQFKSDFWKGVSESKYAKEFEHEGVDNLSRMKKGNAPLVDSTQNIGKRQSYELHHITPINKGGSVYDTSNIMVVTPRFHKEVLTREFHYLPDP